MDSNKIFFSLNPIISPVTNVPLSQCSLQRVPIGEGKESHSTIFPSNFVMKIKLIRKTGRLSLKAGIAL